MKYPNKDYIEHLRRKYRPARGCNSAVWKMRWPCLPALWEPLISSMMPDKST